MPKRRIAMLAESPSPGAPTPIIAPLPTLTAALTYPAANDAGTRASLTILADHPHHRAEMHEDAESIGFRVMAARGLRAHEVTPDDLAPGDNALGDDAPGDPAPGHPTPSAPAAFRLLSDVVLIDCPATDAAMLATLARLDGAVRRARSQLVVATTAAALEDVFGVLDQSTPQILVDPSRAERMMALGRARARLPGRHFRELSGEDRLVLARLAEQVNQIAERINRIDPTAAARASASAYVTTAPAEPGVALAPLSPRPPLPDAKLVRRMIRQRQLRARFFDGDLFADPAWDMLLDLTAAHGEAARVSVTSLCIASGVPPTTALRWIGQMTAAGLLERIEDETDRRRAFIALTERALDAMARYFAALGSGPLDLG